MRTQFLLGLFLGLSVGLVSKSRADVLPGSSGEDLEVFAETTSFEEMLAKKQQALRAPASLEPLARVIAVKRELGLSNHESDIAQQDIILNGGVNSGFSEGMVLSLVRKVPVIDPYRENAQSELEVEFARIKIVHVQNEIAVAHVESLDSIDRGLFLGTRGVLVGDFVSRAKK